MKNSIKFSIIIATYNRLDELQELFQTLLEMKYDVSRYELVIVDDGSTDGTQKYIKNGQWPFHLLYLKQKNQGPGAARNYGMQEANGEYFLFIDSDCMLPPQYLSEIDKGLKKNQFEAFGGPDTFHPSFSPLLKAINYSMTSFIGTGGTRGGKKSVGKFYPRSFNMGIHKSVFDKIGGMGGLRHGQDMDFSARIYEAGFKVGLIPEAFVYHKRRTSLRKFFKQIFNWGVARINLGTKHKNMLKPIHLAPTFLLFGVLISLILAPFIPYGTYLLGLIGMGSIAVALFAFFQSLLTYKSIEVALLSIITLFLQVFAYALGSASGLLQKLKGNKEAKGFTRNYYK